MGYLFQAARGQLSIINHQRPMDEVIRDPKTPPKLKALLEEIPAIKTFGESYGIKPTHNYADYVKLDRPAAVWVVSACEALRFRSKQWGFPIVGQIPYLGWFDRTQAETQAAELRAEGWDVDLRGASAYSTLGWFRDPLLSTMISRDDYALGDLTNVVIHESVHATLYIKGESYFNESLASFVADQLTPTYLERARGARSKESAAYSEQEKSFESVQRLFHQAYLDLGKLYSSSKSEDQKRVEKEAYLKQLKEKAHFRREINNATLIQFKTYDTGKPEFENLIKRCGSDWKKFFKTLSTLQEKSFSKTNEEDFSPVIKALGC